MLHCINHYHTALERELSACFAYKRFQLYLPLTPSLLLGEVVCFVLVSAL